MWLEDWKRLLETQALRSKFSGYMPVNLFPSRKHSFPSVNIITSDHKLDDYTF